MIPTHILRRHPIPLTCRFGHSLVLTWALPAAVLDPLVPPGLSLDTYDERWGFVAVAIVEVRDLRPRRFPRAVGVDLALTGHRIFVRHRDPRGRVRRGLHILRSDTDNRLLRWGGNRLTHYRYEAATVEVASNGAQLAVRVGSGGPQPDLDVVARLGGGPVPLPPSSPFRSERDARRFAGPLPWTFDHEPETASIVVVHGRRTNWRPEPVAVDVRACGFLDRPPFVGAEARLANAFHLADVDYGWDRGVRVPIGAGA